CCERERQQETGGEWNARWSCFEHGAARFYVGGRGKLPRRTELHPPRRRAVRALRGSQALAGRLTSAKQRLMCVPAFVEALAAIRDRDQQVRGSETVAKPVLEQLQAVHDLGCALSVHPAERSAEKRGEAQPE